MTGRKISSQGRRRLTKDELSLWIQVTRTVSPRAGMLPPEASRDELDVVVVSAPGKIEAAPHPEELAKHSKGPYRPQTLPLAPIERRLRQRLSRGQMSVDMKIDLHGMRQDEAHSALRRFLFRARQNEAKLVLVVTGKGGGKVRSDASYGVEGGVLRRSVPHWLSAPELRHLVLGFEEAALVHGGSGALYVRLRGQRSTEGHHT
jgi:DNA-nicking Smr family endonuclease